MIRQKEEITRSLTTAITQMNRIKRLFVDICFHLQPTLDTLNTKDVQLENLELLVDSSDAVSREKIYGHTNSWINSSFIIS